MADTVDDWTFRYRMVLGEHVRINCPEWEMYLTEPDAAQPVVLRAPAGDQPAIQDTTDLVLRGWGYETAEAAEQAALRWRSAVSIGLAANNVMADFGQRSPAFWIHPDVLSADNAQMDLHELMIFPTNLRGHFMGMQPIQYWAGKPMDDVRGAIWMSLENGTELTARQHLAYGTYCSSAGMKPDARLVTLISAVELLIAPENRSGEAQAVVDSLVATVKASGLPQAEKGSMLGALSWLRQQSVGQAVRALATQLGDRRYLQEKELAPKFLTRCYSLRSDLVHGNEIPDFDEVNRCGGELERLVGDLIAISIVHDANVELGKAWTGAHSAADWDGNPDLVPLEGDYLNYRHLLESGDEPSE
ncbi:hypothetical protein ACSMXN_05200 [Jatrophihabitans sp. DSM 45814]